MFANEDEDRVLGGPLPGVDRGSSSAGSVAARLPGTSELRCRVDHVVDSTGAGDALAAGFIVGGPERALDAAARCVTRLGSMP